MQLQVVTPQGSKVEVEASDVNAPGVVGDLGILSGHRPLLTALGIGILTYKTDAGVSHLAVNGGYLEVADDHVVVITETAERPEEVSVERAEASLASARKELGETDPSRTEAVGAAQAAVRRAENRLECAKLTSPKIPV